MGMSSSDKVSVNSNSSELIDQIGKIYDGKIARKRQKIKNEQQKHERNLVMFEKQKQDLEDERTAHKEKVEEFEVQKKDFEAEKVLVSRANAKDGEVLTLNVGGEKTMQVSRSILTRYPDSGLAAMFSGRHPLKKIKG